MPGWTSKTVYIEGSGLVFVLAGPEKAVVADLALQAMTAYLNLPVTSSTPVIAAQPFRSTSRR